ncbi:hypothetical protein OAL66_02085 [bacterium]|nr:hypothetical protein [bacterium]
MSNMDSAKRQELLILNKKLKNYLDCENINAFLESLYNRDAQLYSLCKKSDGQLSYIKYQQMLSLLIKNIFADNQVERLSQWCKSYSAGSKVTYENFKRNNIIIILNNSSQLAHISVLKSLLSIWPIHFPKIYIYILFPGRIEDVTSLKDYLGLVDDQLINLSNLKNFDIPSVYKIISMLKPKGVFWWAWPPGQWLSFLLSKLSNNYSVSFKYDFPTMGNFKAHLYSCSDAYGNLINYKSSTLVPFDLFFDKKDLSTSGSDSFSRGINKNPNQKIFGVLAREEKVAQNKYLETICTILKREPNSIFVWTGRTKRQDIVNYFTKEGLLKRTRWLGFVKPTKFFEVIDIYVDAFPMGSGLTYVQAGLAEKPIVALRCSNAVEPRLSYQLESYLMKQKSHKNIYLSSCLSDSIEDYINYACKYSRMNYHNKTMLADFRQVFENSFCSNQIPYDLAKKIHTLVSS